MSIMEFGVGEGDDKVRQKSEKISFKKGDVKRLSLANYPIVEGRLDLSVATPRFIGASRLYHPSVGYFLDKGPEYQKLGVNPPKTSVATIVVEWPLDRDNEPDQAAIVAGKFNVAPWIFSQDKYQLLAAKHRKWPFTLHDLEVSCSDEKFQKLSFENCRDNLLKQVQDSKKAKTIAERIVAEVAILVEKLPGILCRDLSLEDLRLKIRGDDAGASLQLDKDVVGVDPEEMDNIMDDMM